MTGFDCEDVLFDAAKLCPTLLWATTFFVALSLLSSCQGCEPGRSDTSSSSDAADVSDISDTAGDVPTDSMMDAGADTRITYECGNSALANTVPVSAWVEETTDIRWYRYAADRDEDVIEVELLDGQRASLGTLTVEQFFERSTGRDTPVEARLDREGADALSLTSDAVVADHDAFRVLTEFERDGQNLQVRATFKARACYGADKPEDAGGHPCAWPLPVGEGLFSVPSCGFDVAPDLQSAPNLRRLEYLTGVSTVPALGGVRWDRRLFGSIRAFDGGETTAADTLGRWAKEVGADAILGTRSEELMSAAYGDPAWIDHIEKHIVACIGSGEERTVEQPLVGCSPGRRPGALSTRKQGLGGGCGNDGASSNGDPHLTTYDGSGYDFQAAGEFIMAKAAAGEPFEIQARMAPVDGCRQNIAVCSNVSLNKAVATKVGKTRIGVYADKTPSIYVDGSPVENIGALDLAALLPDGASIEQSGPASIRIEWPGGEILEVSGTPGGVLNLDSELPHARRGQIEGLWGTYNGEPYDDFVTRGGLQMPKPMSFEKRYKIYGESWRVRPEGSLFDYEMGEDTGSFTDRSYPSRPASLEMLPEDLRQQAEDACEDVDGEPAREWCMLDVVCMCDENAADPHEDATPVQEHSGEGARPVVAHGDVCLKTPESLAYQPAAPPDPNACVEPKEQCIAVFRESEGVELSEALPVDVAQAGTFEAEGDLPGGEVPAGTRVDSHLLHLNEVPVGTGLLEGGVTFSGEILGVVVTPTKLKSSDGVVGDGSTSYPDGRGDRGLDWDSERIVIQNGSTLKLELLAESGLDEIRVITKASASTSGN